MHSLSVYRGQSDRGVGEGPGLEVEHGEQYLAADGPLYDKGLLAAIRPWMTLDLDPLDERALGEEAEAWSCFSEGGYSFVTRLSPAGKYDQRSAYFAHGRAWPEQAWDEGLDVCSSLGDAAAFELPWRAEARGPAFDPPLGRLPGIEKVQDAPELAVQLLTHLLDASLQRRSLLMAVPIEDFRRGGRLIAGIALARAALPFPLKRPCSIRLYTRRPRFFLQDAGARLAVTPLDEAESVRSLRGLTLLNREAKVEWGRQASAEALDYAQRVVELACRRPEAIFDFSRRVAPLASTSQSLSALDFRQLPSLYHISASSAQKLEQSLMEALQEPQGFPWESLRADDLRQLSVSALVDILLACDRRLSGLQQRIRQWMADDEFPRETRSQSERMLESQWSSRHPESASRQSLEQLSRLAASKLISDSFAASQSIKAPLQVIAGLQDASSLLEAELRSGQLPKRRLGNPELSRLAAQPSLAGVLAEGVLRQALPSGWMSGWLQQAPLAGLIAFGRRFIGHPEALRHRRDHYPVLLKQLLQHDPAPAELLEPLRKAVSQFELPEDFLPLLSALELGQRCGDPQSYQQLRELWPRLTAIREPDSRRTLVRLCLAEDWKSLHPLLLVQQGGVLRLPAEWEPDVANLLLSSSQLSEQLNLSTLLRLNSRLEGGAREESWKDLAKRIDLLLCEDDADRVTVMAELLRSAGWSDWRERTRLAPERLRSAALAWLASPSWGSSQAPPAIIEEWDQVISDLKASPLNASETSSLFEGQSPRWPWILPFQLQQLQDLARSCCDWDALATLRERLSAQSIAYRLRQPLSAVLQESFNFPAPLPDGFLDSLVGPADPQASLTIPLESLKALFPQQGETGPLGIRSEGLLAQLRQGSAGQLGKDGTIRQGLETARWLKLEQEPDFAAHLAKALHDRFESGKLSTLRPRDLDFLEEWLTEVPPLPDEHQSEPAARYFLSQGKKNLARFLCPDATERKAILEGLDCLLKGRSDHPCWDSLARSVQPDGSHPAAEMARIVRRRSRRLNPSEKRALIQNGWSTFRRAAQRHPAWTSDQPGGPASVLPVLQVAAVLQPERGLGSLAAEVVEMSWPNPRINQPEWWKALVLGIRGCPRLNGLFSADDWPEAAYSLTRAAIRHFAGDDSRAELASEHLDAAWQSITA